MDAGQRGGEPVGAPGAIPGAGPRTSTSSLSPPTEGHSKKPDEAREKILALMGDVPRVELFARQTPSGWDVWGNEVESTIGDFKISGPSQSQSADFVGRGGLKMPYVNVPNDLSKIKTKIAFNLTKR